MSKAGQGNVEPLYDDWFFALTTKRLRRTGPTSSGFTETIRRLHDPMESRIRTLIETLRVATLKRAFYEDNT